MKNTHASPRERRNAALWSHYRAVSAEWYASGHYFTKIDVLTHIVTHYPAPWCMEYNYALKRYRQWKRYGVLSHANMLKHAMWKEFMELIDSLRVAGCEYELDSDAVAHALENTQSSCHYITAKEALKIINAQKYLHYAKIRA